MELEKQVLKMMKDVEEPVLYMEAVSNQDQKVQVEVLEPQLVLMKDDTQQDPVWELLLEEVVLDPILEELGAVKELLLGGELSWFVPV